jgi:hypothetical protein
MGARRDGRFGGCFRKLVSDQVAEGELFLFGVLLSVGRVG